MPGRIHLGTSGFVYDHWKGIFYPKGLPPSEWLRFYARSFRSVELNATFYRLPDPRAVTRWAAAVPDDFVFAAKGSRFLTHMKRMNVTRRGNRRYFSRVRHLGAKLAVVLWQLPPQMSRPDPERLDAFLSALPREWRYAVEFRSAGWYVEEVCAVLDAHGAALVEHDLVPRPTPRVTGGWRYVRFHGAGTATGRYGRRALRPAARDLARSVRRGTNCFVYFNNDAHGFALADAFDLAALLRDEGTRDALSASAGATG